MVNARCRDQPPSLGFLVVAAGDELARRIWATCPISKPHLEYALAHRVVHGVWGGASERARRRILRTRRDRHQSPGPSDG